MGYWVEYIGIDAIALRLDAHSGEQQERDAQLRREFERDWYDAIRPVLNNPKYEGIMLFDADYYIPEEYRERDTTPATNP